MNLDGRNLDPRIAEQRGEGATIAVETLDQMPEEHSAAVTDTYYDLPVIKEAPWKWYVPGYLYAGGLAGAAATMGKHRIALAAESVGVALLIADLGKPRRALNMLRVFRPSSPMNMGTWILATTGASTALSLLTGWRAARVTSAIAGSMLATYTGVLIGNTAVPVWRQARRTLPLWFAATSAASLASLLELTGHAPRRYAVAAKTCDLAGKLAVGELPSKKWRSATWLGVASLAATLLGRPRLAGVLGTAAAVMGRFAVIEAGRASAADPRAALAAT